MWVRVPPSVPNSSLFSNFGRITLFFDGLIEPEKSGHIRNEAVRITETRYIPLTGKEKIENQLEKICRKAKKIEDPFEQSFFLLVHLAYLQAFSDVNKRTSRLSANIPLIRENFAPLSFNDISKDDYIDAILCIYELNNTKPLSEVYKNSYLRSCKIYDIHAEEIGYDEIRVKYRTLRRELISQIIKEKIISNQLENFLDKQIAENVPEKDQDHFRKNILEDLELLNPQRIAGLGMSL